MSAARSQQHESDEPSLRADAERNRRRIVDAAQAVFAETGLDAPLDEIAQRAGVGIATLYRRFPTREDLVAASFAPKMAQYVAAVEEALQAADAWAGFCGYVEHVCAMQAADRGLNDVLALTFPTAKALEEQRAAAYRGLFELVRRRPGTGDAAPGPLPGGLCPLADGQRWRSPGDARSRPRPGGASSPCCSTDSAPKVPIRCRNRRACPDRTGRCFALVAAETR